MRDIAEFVSMQGGELLTDSRRVAAHFGKLHKNVLRAFDELECSSEFNRLNFEPVEFVDEKGETRRQVLMTKNGFMFLAMGFNGRQAALVKEAFISAFDEMAARLRDRSRNLWAELRELERLESASTARASLGGRLLNEHKQALPGFENRRALLEAKSQPRLFDDGEKA